MADDVLINKAASIGRCIARAREEYFEKGGADSFADDLTRQDAAICNIQRACQGAMDIGKHLIRREGMEEVQDPQDYFSPLARHGWISIEQVKQLKRFLVYRHTTFHDYPLPHLSETVDIITNHLEDLRDFSQVILKRDAQSVNQPR